MIFQNFTDLPKLVKAIEDSSNKKIPEHLFNNYVPWDEKEIEFFEAYSKVIK